MGQTSNLSLPYPELGDSADVPRDIKALADAIDAQASPIPAGVIQMWPGAAAPGGWYLCQGQSVPAAANPGLAAIFGTSGANVILPDLRGRVLVGTAPVNVPSSGDAARALRGKGGTTKLAVGQLPAHDHPIGGGGNVPSTSGGGNVWVVGPVQYGSGPFNNKMVMQASGTFSIATRTGNNGSGQESMPPWYAINYIIRAG